MLATVREVTGRAFTCIKIPFEVARFAARFMPFYYRWTRARPRFTRLSLEVLRSNSNISHSKATHELGYQPRPLYERIRDAVKWFLEKNKSIGN